MHTLKAAAAAALLTLLAACGGGGGEGEADDTAPRVTLPAPAAPGSIAAY